MSWCRKVISRTMRCEKCGWDFKTKYNRETEEETQNGPCMCDANKNNSNGERLRVYWDNYGIAVKVLAFVLIGTFVFSNTIYTCKIGTGPIMPYGQINITATEKDLRTCGIMLTPEQASKELIKQCNERRNKATAMIVDCGKTYGINEMVK